MNKLLKFFFIALFFSLNLFSNQKRLYKNVSAKKTKAKIINSNQKTDFDNFGNFNFEIPIKVLLKQKKLSQFVDWSLRSKNGFLVFSTLDRKKKTINNNSISLELKNNKQLCINGWLCSWKKIYIIPLDGFIEFEDYLFAGIFEIAIKNDFVYLINHLDLEDYVASVLPSESWPGWPDEVNRALSICIRSYGVSKILENRRLSKYRKFKIPYDIKNTTVHQVYKGFKDSLKLKKVVDQTKGLVVSFNKKPITAMFDISCGSIIPEKMSGFNFSDAPYLARSYACEYCKNFKCATWKLSYDLKDFETKLKSLLPDLSGLISIELNKTDSAGIVQRIKVKDQNRNYLVSGNKLKSLFSMKSQYFKVEKKDQQIIFKGNGFGHLVGLCQFGLRQMIEEGWNYQDSLRYFYPGTTLMKLIKKC